MKIRRIDHVGVIADDLSAAKAFFLDFGFEVQGEGELEGEWLDQIVGVNGVKTAFVMLGLPDGQANLELIKFYSPSDEKGIKIFSQIQNYENMYKLCYVREPEGIILELAEQIK